MKNRITQILVVLLISGVNVIAQSSNRQMKKYHFIPNHGQWPAQVKYRANVDAGKIWLENKGILYQFRDQSILKESHFGNSEVVNNPSIPQRLLYAEFVGANNVTDVGEYEPSKEYYNFYLGNDSAKWAAGLHGYNELYFEKLYDKIDLRFLENKGELKYEFHVNVGANPSDIKLQYYGFDKIVKNENGEVEIRTSLGRVIEQKPYAYQIIKGQLKEVACEFELTESGMLSFALGDYDHNSKLIIDPVLVFATYSGSASDNFGMTATYANNGEVYSGGVVYGNAYPTPSPAYDVVSNFSGASNTNYGITDVVISKYSADGTSMLWTTYLGGGDDTQGTESVHSLVADTSDNLYLFGSTSSIDFPIQNAYQSGHAGGVGNANFYFNGIYFGNQGTDLFISKLSADGTALMSSTYLGGASNEGLNYNIGGGNYNSIVAYDSLVVNYGDQFRGEIYLDGANNVIIASATRSTNFPVVNGVQTSLGGLQDGLIVKMSNDLSSLMWSSYLGGSSNDICYSIRSSGTDQITVVGGTSSSNFPVSSGLNTAYQGGEADAFVTKMNTNSNIIENSTYLGTPQNDQSYFLQLGSGGEVFITGLSYGSMPVQNAGYSNPGSGQFIMKLDSTLNNIDYSTIYGSGSGQPNISPSAFMVDDCGNIYISGWGANILQTTPLNGMPVTTNAFQDTSANGFDFYLIVLESNAQSLLYGSYFGGSSANEHVDGGTSRFDDKGVLYQSVCGGCGGFSDFPTTQGVWSEMNLSQNCNNLVYKFDPEFYPDANFTISTYQECSPATFYLDQGYTDSIGFNWILPSQATIIGDSINPEIQIVDPGSYDIKLVVDNQICQFNDSSSVSLTVYPPSPQLTTSSDTTLYDFVSVDLIANSYGTATYFTWDDDSNFSSPIISGPTDSVLTINPTVTTSYYINASNGNSNCDVIDTVTITVAPDASTNNYGDGGHIALYPNPVIDILNVKSLISIRHLSVYDQAGKLILNENNLDKYSLEIDVSTLSSGSYVLTLQDKSGTIVQKKFVK